MSAKKPPRLAGLGRRKKLVVACLAIACALIAHMTQSAVKSHNGPADRLQSVGGACR